MPRKKKKYIICPVCNQPIEVAENLVPWSSVQEVEKLEPQITKLTNLVDEIIEVLHHDEAFKKHANRIAIFYTLLQRFVEYIALSNAEKCGLLELTKYQIIKMSQIQQEEIIKEEIRKKKEKGYVR